MTIINLQKGSLAIAIFLIAFCFISCSCTKKFYTKEGKTLTNSVAELRTVKIGGIEQFLLIRGKNAERPLLLFLHGGPGTPYSPLAHSFQKEWEEHFIVVHWDQRGAGKSFSSGIPPESITKEQYIRDGHEVMAYLLHRFHQEKLYIIGHSWGSYLGMQLASRYPEMIHAYIGAGQMISLLEQEKSSHQFVLHEAHQRKDKKAIKKLRGIGYPPYANVREGFGTKYSLLAAYGAYLDGETSLTPLVKTSFAAPEYSLWDMLKFARGSSFTMKNLVRNEKDNFWNTDVTNIKSLEVPVFFFAGKYDQITPVTLVRNYFVTLQAPRKSLIIFERSGHFTFLTEKQRFLEALRMVLADAENENNRNDC